MYFQQRKHEILGDRQRKPRVRRGTTKTRKERQRIERAREILQAQRQRFRRIGLERVWA